MEDSAHSGSDDSYNPSTQLLNETVRQRSHDRSASEHPDATPARAPGHTRARPPTSDMFTAINSQPPRSREHTREPTPKSTAMTFGTVEDATANEKVTPQESPPDRVAEAEVRAQNMCKMKGCVRATTGFRNPTKLIRHYVGTHKFAKDDAQAVVDGADPADFMEVEAYDEEGPGGGDEDEELVVERRLSQAHATPVARFDHFCSVRECERATTGFTSRSDLRKHLQRVHRFTVEQADDIMLGADPDIYHESSEDERQKAETEARAESVSWIPNKFSCRVDGCLRNGKPFSDFKSLRKHLKAVEKKSSEEINAIIAAANGIDITMGESEQELEPGANPEPWVPNEKSCPVPGCLREGEPFQNFRGLERHLQQVEKLTPEVVQTMLETARSNESLDLTSDQEAALKANNSHIAESYEPNRFSCLLEGCFRRRKPFSNFKDLRRHLQQVEQLPPDEIEAMLTAAKASETTNMDSYQGPAEDVKTTPRVHLKKRNRVLCPVKNCLRGDKPFRDTYDLKSHLKSTHKMTPEEAQEMANGPPLVRDHDEPREESEDDLQNDQHLYPELKVPPNTASARQIFLREITRDLDLRPGKTLKNFTKKTANLESALAQQRGEVMAGKGACKSCQGGHGPYRTCVVLSDAMNGSCAGCHYNGEGARCTLRPISKLDSSIIENRYASPAVANSQRRRTGYDVDSDGDAVFQNGFKPLKNGANGKSSKGSPPRDREGYKARVERRDTVESESDAFYHPKPLKHRVVLDADEESSERPSVKRRRTDQSEGDRTEVVESETELVGQNRPKHRLTDADSLSDRQHKRIRRPSKSQLVATFERDDYVAVSENETPVPANNGAVPWTPAYWAIEYEKQTEEQRCIEEANLHVRLGCIAQARAQVLKKARLQRAANGEAAGEDIRGHW